MFEPTYPHRRAPHEVRGHSLPGKMFFDIAWALVNESWRVAPYSVVRGSSTFMGRTPLVTFQV